jgi:hypothetical protein
MILAAAALLLCDGSGEHSWPLSEKDNESFEGLGSNLRGRCPYCPARELRFREESSQSFKINFYISSLNSEKRGCWWKNEKK